MPRMRNREIILKEQRLHARKLMHEPAFLSDVGRTAWVPVILLDISLRGVSFASPGVVIGGELRLLRFTMPGTPQSHAALISVVHSSSAGVPVGFKVGAKFEEIDAGTTDAIADFLSKPPAA
jgi:hypothetical protein